MDVYPIYKSYVSFWWYDIYQNGKGIQHAIVVHWLFHDTCILLSCANGDTSNAIGKSAAGCNENGIVITHHIHIHSTTTG